MTNTSDASAHEPEGSSEIRPEGQPIEAPAPAATPGETRSQPLEVRPAEPSRTPLASEPTPIVAQVPGAFGAGLPASAQPAAVERAEELEAIPLSAREARILSAEAPHVQAETISPATPPPVPPPPPHASTPPASSAQAAGTEGTGTAAGTTLPPPPAPSGATPAWRARRQHLWAILCHLFLFLTIPTIFLGATLTFLIWQLKGKNSREIEEHGREALNFQINVAVLTLLLGVTCLGAPLIPVVWLVAAIFAVLAARAASDGEAYRYPYVLRIVTH